MLVHELAHVHGARYHDFGRAGAEVVAETAALVALSAARLDTGSQSVSYASGWADAAPKDLAAYADAAHQIAAALEVGLALGSESRERQLPIREGAPHVRAPDALARSDPPARAR